MQTILQKFILSLILSLTLVTGTVQAQCLPSTSQWPQNTIYPVSGGWQTATTTMYGGDYAVFSVSMGQTYAFSLCTADGGLTGYDSQLTLFNDATPQVPIAFADQSCGSNAKITWQATFTGLLRVQVNQYNCTDNTVFTTLRYQMIQAGIPPVNDQCFQATNLNVGMSCSPVNGTVANASPSGPVTACNGQAEDDVWYTFTAQSTNDVSFLISPAGAGFDPVVEFFTGNSCNNINSIYCLDAATDGGAESITVTQLSVGQTIWIRVYDYYTTPASNPDFTICLFQNQPVTPGDECGVAHPVSISQTCTSPAQGNFSNYTPSTVPASNCVGNPKDAWYTFTITATDFFMDIDPSGLADPAFEYFSGSCGTLTSLGCVNNYGAGVTEQVAFYDGVIGAVIYLRVFDAGGNTASNQNFGICLYEQMGATPPMNDACAGAGLLTAGSSCTPVGGTLQNAGASTPLSTCGGSNTDDVWYKVMPSDTAVNVEIAPNGQMDVVFEVFTGTCGALTSQFCVDNVIQGNPETVLITGTQPGQPFYIRVYDYNEVVAANPTFTVCAWWDAPSCDIAPPQINANGPTTVCGGPVGLSAIAPPGVNLQWYRNGLLIPGAVTQAYSADQTGNYYLIASLGPNCAKTSNTISVTIQPDILANFSVAGGPNVCQGDSLLLTANAIAGASYQWLINGVPLNNGNFQTFYAKVSGNYSVRVTAGNCSATSFPQQINSVFPPPKNLITGGATSFCMGGYVVLYAPTGDGYTYQWLRNGILINNASADSYTVTEAGVYNARIIGETCASLSDNVTVNVLPPPSATITATGPTQVCQGNTVNLMASGDGNIWRWQRNGIDITGANGTAYLAGETGTYTVITTNTANCSDTSNSIVVTINPMPEATITPSGPTTFCAGGNVLLEATSGTNHTYQWKRNGQELQGVVFQQISVNEPGMYTVRVTNAGNCTAESPGIQVNVGGVVANISIAGPSAICDGNAVLMTANDGFGLSYIWLKDNVPQGVPGQRTYSATQSGNYTVTVSDANGCSSTSPAISISVGQSPPKPEITASGRLDFCQGGQVELTTPLVQEFQYQWFRDTIAISQATMRIYQASSTGLYKVRVQNIAGCQNSSDALEVLVRPLPEVFFNLNPSVTCEASEPYQLSGGSPAGGEYSGPGVSSGMFSPEVTGTGEWVLTYTFTNDKGCQADTTAKIIVENCAGVPAANISEITAYPNPFDESVRINTGGGTWAMFDLSGRMVDVHPVILAGNQIELHTGHLAEGIYHLLIVRGEMVQTIRLAKTRR